MVMVASALSSKSSLTLKVNVVKSVMGVPMLNSLGGGVYLRLSSVLSSSWAGITFTGSVSLALAMSMPSSDSVPLGSEVIFT